MEILVFANLFKLFRLVLKFAREVYHLGRKISEEKYMYVNSYSSDYPQRQTACANVLA